MNVFINRKFSGIPLITEFMSYLSREVIVNKLNLKEVREITEYANQTLNTE